MVIQEDHWFTDKLQIIPGTKLVLLALELVDVVQEPQEFTQEFQHIWIGFQRTWNHE